MATATIGYDKESPCDKLARLIAAKVLASTKERPELWTSDQKRIAHACIKYLAFGIDSENARRHTLASRPRFIHLHTSQNDILLCSYLEVEMEDPELFEQAATVRELFQSIAQRA
jgi:hypothetical protein